MNAKICFFVGFINCQLVHSLSIREWKVIKLWQTRYSSPFQAFPDKKKRRIRKGCSRSFTHVHAFPRARHPRKIQPWFLKAEISTFTYPWRSWTTETAVEASSPVVGSSRNKTDGDIINSIPMLVRLRSPPEIPRIKSFPTLQVSNSNYGKNRKKKSFSFERTTEREKSTGL